MKRASKQKNEDVKIENVMRRRFYPVDHVCQRYLNPWEEDRERDLCPNWRPNGAFQPLNYPIALYPCPENPEGDGLRIGVFKSVIDLSLIDRQLVFGGRIQEDRKDEIRRFMAYFEDPSYNSLFPTPKRFGRSGLLWQATYFVNALCQLEFYASLHFWELPFVKVVIEWRPGLPPSDFEEIEFRNATLAN
ncbi:MAG: hypothetical protein KDA87_00810 [Planctomycetales bacterium]|nr:hypothetical protein [Planctomycetales bacterium]